MDWASPVIVAALVSGGFLFATALLNYLSAWNVARIERRTQQQIEQLKLDGQLELERQSARRTHRSDLVAPIQGSVRDQLGTYRQVFAAIRTDNTDNIGSPALCVMTGWLALV